MKSTRLARRGFCVLCVALASSAAFAADVESRRDIIAYHNGNNILGQVQFGYSGAPLKPEIDRLTWIRRQYLAGSQSYLVTNPTLKADLFISLRDGGGTKPGSILVINDHASSALGVQVQTIYPDTVLRDWVLTNAYHSVTTDVNGVVTLEATSRSYRVYSVTNALTE